MSTRKTWVLAANERRARIFGFSKDQWVELTELSQAELKISCYDLGFYGTDFVKILSQYLDLEYRMKQFRGLHVVAPGEFLALLNKSLHADTQKSILTMFDSNIADQNSKRIRKYISLIREQ